jgi:SpoVK/Ycf46/Vps4 family AAA+-type ATPase
MAKAEYILSLIKAHFNNEDEHFITIALQIAATEAKLWHNLIAQAIKKLVERSKIDKVKSYKYAIPNELQWLVIESFPSNRLVDLIAPKTIKDKIDRIVHEYAHRDKLSRNDLKNRRKILLSWHPWTGKTFTASIIATELGLPMNTILMEKLVTKYMWETSVRLRQVFDMIKGKPGVYLFDEFDAIGWERSRDNDVWEMRRVLNSFLQFLEHDDSESIVISITNNSKLLDQALFRRFDDVIAYNLPTMEEKNELLRNRLVRFGKKIDYTNILPKINWLSHAEITLACMDAIKDAVLNDQDFVSNESLAKTIEDRNAAYHH